jgi:RNA polymerase sigma-70 factor (ECF subfamily)
MVVGFTMAHEIPTPVTSEIDDIALARVVRGDATAWRDFVRCYERMVFALVSRLCAGGRGDGLVEDLAQECFLRVFKALPTFRLDGAAKLSTWILTIATRVTIDELRRRRVNLVPLDQMQDCADSKIAPADQQLFARQIQRWVVSLEPEMRAAMALRVFHDLSYEEIADALEIEVGTVKSRIGRARAILRQRLEEERP